MTDEERQTANGGALLRVPPIHGISEQSTLEKYTTDEGKLKFDGFSYQLKLLVLLVLRGSSNHFYMATEIKDTGKFDAVISEHRKDMNGGKGFRFLQTIYNNSETREGISIHDLLQDDKGDFNLQKYFHSFLQLQENPKFTGADDEIKDLILFTNRNFKYGDRFWDLELCNDILQCEKTIGGDEKLDEILQTYLLWFKEDFEGKSILMSHLKDTFIDLPKQFAEKVFQGKELELDNYHAPPELFPLAQAYEAALLHEVIDEENGRFREGFLKQHNLSPEANHFRGSLQRMYSSQGLGNGMAFEDMIRDTEIKVYSHLRELQPVIHSFEILAEKLAGLVQENSETKIITVSDSECQIAKDIQILAGSVFIKEEGRVKINPGFFYESNFPGNINTFRENLVCELKKKEIELITMKDYVFQTGNFPDKNEYKITGSYIEKTACSFLEKLRFAVNQPNEDSMDVIIKSEVLKGFKENEIENFYGRFLVKTYDWIKDQDGKYFSYSDCCLLFEQIKKEMLASIWFEVKNPTLNFTGRERELFTLKKNIQGTKKSQLVADMNQSVIISGLDGVGKTELVKQFVYLHSYEYENLIWINAESNSTMADSFYGLAFDHLGIKKENAKGQAKTLESIVDEVYDILWGKESLFIFDNAEKMQVGLNAAGGIQNFMPKFPSKSKHYTLITSKSTQWGDFKQVKLGNFTEKEALELIGKSINLSKGPEKVQAKNLAKALHCYPIALHQAIAYIQASHEENVLIGQSFTITDYLDLFQKASTDLDILFPSENNDSFTKCLCIVWKITLDHINCKESGKVALNILNSISYLASDHISVDNIANVLGTTEYSDVISPLRLLKQYSMVDIENKKASVHKLTQILTRHRLKEEGKEVEMLRAVLIAASKIDTEHVVTAWEFSSNYCDLITMFGYLASNIIHTLCKNLKLKEAHSFGRCSIKTLKKHLGDKHEFVLDAKYSLARVLEIMGNYEESLMEYEDLYYNYKTILGEDNPNTLKMKQRMANMMCNLGNHYEALDYYKSVYNKISNLHGEDTQDALDLKQNIANVLCKLGENTQALKLYKEIHEKLKLSKGESDSYTLNAKQNIGYVLEKLGDYYEALNCYEDIDNQSSTILTDDDPLTIKTKYNIASALNKIGRYDEALNAYQYLHRIYAAKYGKQHPESIDMKVNISNILIKLGRNDEALKSFEVVYELMKNLYGVSHQKTIHTKLCIAQVLSNSKENEEALMHYQEVYDHLCKSLGEKDPKVLHVKQSIANTLYNVGAHAKALQSYQEIYEQIKMDLGEDHSHTISIKQFMASMLYKLGKYEEAFKLYKEVHHKMRIIYGEWNENTLTAQKNMASVLLKLGKASESLSCFESVYDKQRAVFGVNHPSTIETKENMAIAWHKMTNQSEEDEYQTVSTHNQSENNPDLHEHREAVDSKEDNKYKSRYGKNNIINVKELHFNPNSSFTCPGCLKRYAYTCTLQ